MGQASRTSGCTCLAIVAGKPPITYKMLMSS